MKRSEINKVLEDTKALVHKHQITLPPFAYWFPKYWVRKGIECDEIHDCMLGWDITDFGSGEFDKTGLAVFTVRNGHNSNEKYRHKSYCEKLSIVAEEGVTPMHFHWPKVARHHQSGRRQPDDKVLQFDGGRIA